MFAYINIMKIAIAYHNNRVSPVFDESDKVLIIHIQNRREVKRVEAMLRSRNPFARAEEVSGLEIDVLICGAVSRGLEAALVAAGVRVVGFVCGYIDEILSAYVCKRFVDDRFFMPGCRGRQRRHRRRGRHGRGG